MNEEFGLRCNVIWKYKTHLVWFHLLKNRTFLDILSNYEIYLKSFRKEQAKFKKKKSQKTAGQLTYSGSKKWGKIM